MRNTAFILLGLLLTLLQANLFRVLDAVHIPGLVPALVLPVVLFMGVHEYSPVRGASLSFVLGYVTDLIGIAPLGLYTSTYVALFILARTIGVRFATQTYLMQLTLSLAFAFLHSVMILVLLAIFLRDPYVPRTIYPMALPHVLATAVVAPIILRLSLRIHTWTSRPGDPRPGHIP